MRIQNENTQGIIGLCLSPLDLAISKLAAGREKDLQFVTAMLKHKMIAPENVRHLFSELDSETSRNIEHRLQRCLANAQGA